MQQKWYGRQAQPMYQALSPKGRLALKWSGRKFACNCEMGKSIFGVVLSGNVAGIGLQIISPLEAQWMLRIYQPSADW